ncbi:MAG: Calx-beta domain-containing protein, partial [Gammaproteobacteria bacterium]
TGTYSVAENGASVLVTVTRTGGSAGAVSVGYATGNGTALAGSDYTTSTGTLDFANGVSSQSFSVPILNDSVPESSESFTLSLSNVTGGASLGAVSTATVTINDDDSDSNGDGISDAQALANALDPNVVSGDTDGDGITDALELGDPANPTDTDGDGIIDALEPGTAATDAAMLSFFVTAGVAQAMGVNEYANEVVQVSEITGATLVIEANPATGLPLFVESDLPTGDTAYDYPLGLYSYRVVLPVGQDTATVTVQLPPGAALPANTVIRKLDVSGTWRTVNNALIDLNQRSFTLTLTDNDGVFDTDPAIGTIADPVGIAVAVAAVQPAGSGGGGGGCTLVATATTSLDPVFPLSLLVAAGGLYRRYRRVSS